MTEDRSADLFARTPWRGAVATREPGEKLDETAMRVSFALLLGLVGGPVLGLLAIAVGATGREGLDYVFGGGALGVGLGLPVLGIAGLLVSGCLSWVRQFRTRIALPLLFAGLPLALAGGVAMALGRGLGVEEDERGLLSLVQGLLQPQEVTSAGWLLIGRVGAVLFVVGLVVLFVTGRVTAQMLRRRWR